MIALCNTGWRRPIGCLIFIGHLTQKSPIISGSFAENDLQLKASYESSPPCTQMSTPIDHGTFGSTSTPSAATFFPRSARTRNARFICQSVNIIALFFGTSMPSTATFFPRGARTGDARFAPLPPRAPAAASKILQSQLYIYTYIYM